MPNPKRRIWDPSAGEWRWEEADAGAPRKRPFYDPFVWWEPGKQRLAELIDRIAKLLRLC